MENGVQPEEHKIQQSINAVLDSVGLINGIINGTQLQNQNVISKVNRIEANVGHLTIMLEKEWFTQALTIENTEAINLSITSGNSYIAANQQ
jgi:hypothetical protein